MLKYIPRKTFTLNMKILIIHYFIKLILNFKGDLILSTSSGFVETLRHIEDCSDIILNYPVWTSHKYLYHVLNTNRVNYETLNVYLMRSHRIK